MEKIQQYIKTLTEASRNRKLVFFVGAGLSTLSDYPQWWELVEKYYFGLYGKTKDGSYSSDEYLRIPQIFYDVKGIDEFDSVLKDVFSVERAPNSIHDKILAMNPVHIISTNYDDLIDKVCWKRGRYFSVISAEEDVAKATSSRYILKVHGDFRRGYAGGNIVLKESDYVNYEHNYPLISNLMKTIMATHTIVFIGYGLGDYNINLLLNWVKILQKESFNKPFFIRTDPEPIEDNISKYYENKGLRIIDAASLVESEKQDYIKRYSAVMDTLIESKDNGLLSEDNEIVGYIYERLSPLFVLQCIRKLDLNHVFEYDYHFAVNGTVIRNKNEAFGYIERFFELKAMENNNLSMDSNQKLEEISIFFEKNGIVSMMKDATNRIMNTSLEIKSSAYHNNYDEMEMFIQSSSHRLEDDYRRAFYLAYLGEWEEAYVLYSELLLKSIDESNWWIHYLSQINRYRLYQSIVQIANQFDGIGILTFGFRYKPFTDDFLKRIKWDMKNFSIDDVYNGMPYDFQKKYRILEFLSDNEFLYDDTVKLFELTNKVRNEMSKGTYSFGGLTSDFEVQCRLNENVRFIYENCLWAGTFIEFKQYMRNSLMLQFEKAEYDLSREIGDLGISLNVGKSSFYVNYYDFVNVAKSFSVDDLKHIERNCKIESIEFREMDKIEKYLMQIADEIIKHFSKDGMNIIFYNQFISEAKVAFYFARYVKLSEDGLLRLLKAVLFYFPERDLDIGKRYLWADRFTQGSGLPTNAIPIIEEYLINQADKHMDSQFSEQSTNNLFSRNFVNLILYFHKAFVSYKLSVYTLNLNKEMINQVDFMYRLSPILSESARNHLLQLKKIEDIDGFMDSVRMNIVSKISDYQDLIINYMDNRMSNVLRDRAKKVKVIYANDYVLDFGIWYFIDELSDKRMMDYIGIDDEYDLFIDPEHFDYSKFKATWLKKYPDDLLEKIARNSFMHPHVIEVLKERIINSKDKKYIEIFIKHFIL